jgi:hypothetical protein
MRFRTILASAALAATSASLIPAALASGEQTGTTHEMTLERAVTTAAQLRAQLRRERAAHARAIRRLRRAAVARADVRHAIALGSAAYGLPKGRLEGVAFCESGLNTHAANGRYLGLFQFGSRLWNATPYRDFQRTDPYAASFAAAWAFSRGMARHWPICGR